MKPFFDVFPTLQVKGDLRDYFAETQVERLTTNKERTRIKVVLRSDHLIHKKRVFKMQEEISRQVFGDRAPEVYIDEHYTLSSQYTPRRLMEEYFDSLVSEIGSFSHVMGLYFREARVEYRDDENVLIMLQDSCLSRKLSMKLEEALNRIFRERCGVSAALTVGLEQRKKEKEEPRRPSPCGESKGDTEIRKARTVSFRGTAGRRNTEALPRTIQRRRPVQLRRRVFHLKRKRARLNPRADSAEANIQGTAQKARRGLQASKSRTTRT